MKFKHRIKRNTEPFKAFNMHSQPVKIKYNAWYVKAKEQREEKSEKDNT